MTVETGIPPPVPVGPAAPRRRCARHEEREAVARCVGCGGGFCRECITEHEGRFYCAPCFARQTAAGKKPARARVAWRGGVVTAGSLLCLTLAFYLLGRLLAAMPPQLHDGTVWKETFGR